MPVIEEYDFEQLVIHGSPETAANMGWTHPTGSSYTSHNGLPAFCMHLKVTDFYRNTDGTVGCTIRIASLRTLIPPGSSQHWYFGYPFTVYASLLIGDVADYGGDYAAMLAAIAPLSKIELFSKPSGVSNWGDNEYYLPNPRVLTAPSPQGKKLYLIISILSICSCAQTGIDTPVYIDDISEYIPDKKPYFWRMQQGKDPNHPTTEAQNWHLVRPFYICKQDGQGNHYWCSCEE